MGFEVDDHHTPNSTPKITLSKLPYLKPRQPPYMQTPPLRPPASVPFRWEEAPGKPRSATAAPPPSSKNIGARFLNLPPRLLRGGSRIAIMPPTTSVLDGPYVGRSLSFACTISLRKGPGLGRARNFGSCRGNSGFSYSLGDVIKDGKNEKNARIRRGKFFNFSTMNSNSWGNIYASFKHAISGRRRRPL